jgi:hypothetical protein
LIEAKADDFSTYLLISAHKGTRLVGRAPKKRPVARGMARNR